MILNRRGVIASRFGESNTPLQQVKGAGLSARGKTTQGLPAPVRNVQVAVSRAGASRTLRVTFTQAPNDPYFVKAEVYTRNGLGNAVLVASGTSPITFTVQKSQTPLVVFVVSAGNWGTAPLSFADSKVVSIA